MKLVFIALTCCFACLYLLSMQKYREFIGPVDKKIYPLKGFMPIGLFLLDRVRYTYNTRYDRRILSKLVQVVEPRYAQYYLRIYWANKIILLMLALLFASFIGAFAEVDSSFAFLAGIILAGAGYYSYYELQERIKRRRALIQIDFPDFINKLALLINAGMTVPKAWEKIVLDNKKERPLYEELQMAIKDIGAGKPENKAYEDFAKRCRTPEITKFVTVVLQNVKKGTGDLVSILRVQSNECWELRKSAAKRLGEEASTKMLFPMMIVFIAILIIVAAPAILAMKEI